MENQIEGNLKEGNVNGGNTQWLTRQKELVVLAGVASSREGRGKAWNVAFQQVAVDDEKERELDQKNLREGNLNEGKHKGQLGKQSLWC